ncbi:MAG: prepilin-type N-terminal cleavage/methylation domain-containing protein, partial [Escherichia coli]|nr:prepilin-type N-terminal cleavage/methylation domain-containing protein [Escherichia coli]
MRGCHEARIYLAGSDARAGFTLLEMLVAIAIFTS